MSTEGARLVVGIGPDGRIAYVSDVSTGSLAANRRPTDWLGVYIWDTVPAAQRARVRQAFAESLLTGERQTFECETDHGGIIERWRSRCDRASAPISVLLQTEKLEEFDDRALTKRERQIVSLMIQDYTIEEIAVELRTKASTVTTHQANIRIKLGCSTNAGVAVWGVRAGL